MGLGEQLEELYEFYNDKKYVHPDPLEFLYDFNDLKDREIVGLIASLLAYGRVSQILKSVSKILKVLKDPYDFITNSSKDDIYNSFKGFKHRFTTEEDISDLLFSVKKTLKSFGSLNNCFLNYFSDLDSDVSIALKGFIRQLGSVSGIKYGSLLSKPDGSSAFKRFNLYLRWMVRKDNVDPGGWEKVSASKLIIPLDTHMYRICCNLNFTKRKQSDIKSAVQITSCFKNFDKNDPVKYDFALTRLGMNRDDKKLTVLFNECFPVEV